MKWERVYDSEIFDEDNIDDALAECVGDEELKDAIDEFFTFGYLWKHLSEDAKSEIYDVAKEIALHEYFNELDEDEDEG